MDEERLKTIQELAEPILAAASTEAVEWSCHRHGGRLMVRLLVDKIGGVTVHDCTRLNRQIGQALEVSPAVEEPYVLEVSSPGLDRPLMTPRDFERAIGEPVELHMRQALEGKMQIDGNLLVVQPEAVVVVTAQGPVTVPFDAIARATKAIRL